jgi:hypothetical protein
MVPAWGYMNPPGDIKVGVLGCSNLQTGPTI